MLNSPRPWNFLINYIFLIAFRSPKYLWWLIQFHSPLEDQFGVVKWSLNSSEETFRRLALNEMEREVTFNRNKKRTKIKLGEEKEKVFQTRGERRRKIDKFPSMFMSQFLCSKWTMLINIMTNFFLTNWQEVSSFLVFRSIGRTFSVLR